MSDLICVAVIAGAFGVQGEVRLKSFTSQAEAIADYAPLSDEDGSNLYELRVLRSIKNGLAVRLSGVTNKEQADALRGIKLFVPRVRLPQLPDDEYYYSDLIGMTVLDSGGTELGQIKSVQNHGATDLLEVQCPDHSATVLLPFTRAMVPNVDLTARRVITDPPDGAFPDPK